MACSLADEAERFASACSSQISALDAMRKRTRHQRGLSITHEVRGGSLNASGLGVGHHLNAIYRLHALCVALDRYCYIRLHDSSIHKEFVYADGQSWEPMKDEMQRYSGTHVSVRYRRRLWDKQQNLSKVEAVLASRVPCKMPDCLSREAHRTRKSIASAALIHLTLVGWPPFEQDDALERAVGRDATLFSPVRAHQPNGLDPCLCRYVTTPSPSLAAALPPRDFVATRSAVHLRTGYADQWNDRRLESIAASQAEAATWLSVACPRPEWLLAASDGRGRHFVLSDAPGLLREIDRRRGVKSAKLLPESHSAMLLTRTWQSEFADGATRAALVDIVQAGLSAELYIAPQLHLCNSVQVSSAQLATQCGMAYAQNVSNWHWSAFHRPLLSRSMCMQRVALTVPGCEPFASTFPRDLPLHLGAVLSGRALHRRVGRLLAPMSEEHPCKQTRGSDGGGTSPKASTALASACYRSWLAACK